MAYDQLGRLTQRIDPEYTSTFTYDTCSMGRGKLCASRTSHGLWKSWGFDSLGRPTQSRMEVRTAPNVVERVFVNAVTYHPSTGRPEQRVYPSGLRTVDVYTPKGKLSRVTLATAVTIQPLPASPGGARPAAVTWPAGRTIWEATAVNAWGRAEGERYGDVVNRRAAFDAATGRVHELSAGMGAGNVKGQVIFPTRGHSNLPTRLGSRRGVLSRPDQAGL